MFKISPIKIFGIPGIETEDRRQRTEDRGQKTGRELV